MDFVLIIKVKCLYFALSKIWKLTNIKISIVHYVKYKFCLL